MTFLTLVLTGGLHMDGLMDTCDALFSHRDRITRLKILSDTHAGSFAVMGCVSVFLFKTFLFSEIFSHDINLKFIFLIPFFSRFGMGFLLNNLKFAKSDGLAAVLGASRKKSDNIFFIIIFMILFFVSAKIIFIIFILSLIIWKNLCLKTFGGITGDLLGAFVEISEILILIGTVIDFCI